MEESELAGRDGGPRWQGRGLRAQLRLCSEIWAHASGVWCPGPSLYSLARERVRGLVVSPAACLWAGHQLPGTGGCSFLACLGQEGSLAFGFGLVSELAPLSGPGAPCRST